MTYHGTARKNVSKTKYNIISFITNQKKDLFIFDYQEVKVGYFGYVIVLLWYLYLVVLVILFYIFINKPQDLILPNLIKTFTKLYTTD